MLLQPFTIIDRHVAFFVRSSLVCMLRLSESDDPKIFRVSPLSEKSSNFKGIAYSTFSSTFALVDEQQQQLIILKRNQGTLHRVVVPWGLQPDFPLSITFHGERFWITTVRNNFENEIVSLEPETYVVTRHRVKAGWNLPEVRMTGHPLLFASKSNLVLYDTLSLTLQWLSPLLEATGQLTFPERSVVGTTDSEAIIAIIPNPPFVEARLVFKSSKEECIGKWDVVPWSYLEGVCLVDNTIICMDSEGTLFTSDFKSSVWKPIPASYGLLLAENVLDQLTYSRQSKENQALSDN